MICTMVFCVASLYVDVELSKPKFYITPVRNEGYWCSYRSCKGPLADLTIGMPVQVTEEIRIAYGFKHSSFPMDRKDVGQNGWFISFKWEPFK